MSQTFPTITVPTTPVGGSTSPLLSIEDMARWPDPDSFVLLQISRHTEQRPEDVVDTALRLVRLSLADFSGAETPISGRQPLPEHGTLVATLEAAGLTADTPLILFADTAKDLGATARAWVTLRWAGARDVRVLNGVFRPELREALAAFGHDSKTTEVLTPAPNTSQGSQFVIDPTVTVDGDAIAVGFGSTTLVDARPVEAFGAVDEKGQREHIPGAVSVPSAVISDHGAIVSPEHVVAAFSAVLETVPAGRELALYCGSGVSASVDALALASIGVVVPVYIGSWSEWSKRQ